MFWSQTNVNCIFLGTATVNNVAMEMVGGMMRHEHHFKLFFLDHMYL